jgi:hypothetical protein
MAIQGILCGFADPANLAANLILVGRGANYVLLVNGKPVQATDDIAQARHAFRVASAKHCAPHWLSVSNMTTDGVNGHSTVIATETVNATFAERYPAHDDEGSDD